MTRWVDEPLLEELAQRVRSRPEGRKPRKELVAHPFGTMQRGWDHGYFVMRGLEKGRTECSGTVRGVQSPAGMEPHRDAAAAGRPGLRRVASLGSWVGSICISGPLWKGSFQRPQAFACPGTALQQRVLTQSGALFGPVESQGCSLTPHRMESLPGVGLDHDKAGHHPVMLDVESAQRCR